MESKKINNNEHPYVDLGLPSGTLWSTCNVGASKPSELGLYFQWGDTKGYKEDQVGMEKGKKTFEFEDYKWFTNYIERKFTKYTKRSSKLKLEDDAANFNMGGDWHMPTNEQIEELLDKANTKCDWIELDGISGMKITSRKDETKSIFIPAAGYGWYKEVFGVENIGCIWSSMLDENDTNCCYGQRFYVGPYGVKTGYTYRYYGFSVRGVIG